MSKQENAYYLIPENNAPEIQLNSGLSYKIGRSNDCDIVVTDSAVSREHARLEFSKDTFFLEDMGSTNGTRINGGFITKETLKNRDTIRLGNVSFMFEIRVRFPEADKTLSPSDSRMMDDDLHKIISGLDNPALKDKLQSFQMKMNKKKKSLMELAYNDGLTGLYNRRYFDKMLDTEIKRSNRYKRTLTLIMADIDHFKKFNDTYGHQKGDSVLKTVGRILKENSRSSDIVCRYGGEEMVLLLPEQSLEQGLATAEKLRKAVMVQAKELEGVEITASFGVSCTHGETSEGSDLVKRTDEALYLAKKDGRNCTRALIL